MLTIYGSAKIQQLLTRQEFEDLSIKASATPGVPSLQWTDKKLFARATFMGYDLPNGNGDAVPRIYAAEFGPSFISRRVDNNHLTDDSNIVGKILHTWHREIPTSWKSEGPRVIGRNMFGRDADAKRKRFGLTAGIETPTELQLEGIFEVNRTIPLGEMLAQRMISGELKMVSQEANTAYCVCSVCGHMIAKNGASTCAHLDRGSLMVRSYLTNEYPEEILAYKIHHEPVGTGLGIVTIGAYSKAYLQELQAKLESGEIAYDTAVNLLAQQVTVFGSSHDIEDTLAFANSFKAKLESQEKSKVIVDMKAAEQTPKAEEEKLNAYVQAVAAIRDQAKADPIIAVQVLAEVEGVLNHAAHKLYRQATHIMGSDEDAIQATGPESCSGRVFDLATRTSVLAGLYGEVEGIKSQVVGPLNPVFAALSSTHKEYLGAKEKMITAQLNGSVTSADIKAFEESKSKRQKAQQDFTASQLSSKLVSLHAMAKSIEALREALINAKDDPSVAAVKILKASLDRGLPAARTTGLFLSAAPAVDKSEYERLDTETKAAWEAFDKAFDAWYEAGSPTEGDPQEALKKAMDESYVAFQNKFSELYKAIFPQGEASGEGQQAVASLVASLLGVDGSSVRKFRLIDGMTDLGNSFLASGKEESVPALMAMFVKSMKESAMSVEDMSAHTVEALQSYPSVALEMSAKMIDMTAKETKDEVLTALLGEIDTIRANRKGTVEFLASLSSDMSLFQPLTMKAFKNLLDSHSNESLANLSASLDKAIPSIKDGGLLRSALKAKANLMYASLERARGQRLTATFHRQPDIAASYWLLSGLDGNVLARVYIKDLAGGDLDQTLHLKAKSKGGAEVDVEIKAIDHLTSKAYGEDIKAWASAYGPKYLLASLGEAVDMTLIGRKLSIKPDAEDLPEIQKITWIGKIRRSINDYAQTFGLPGDQTEKLVSMANEFLNSKPAEFFKTSSWDRVWGPVKTHLKSRAGLPAAHLAGGLLDVVAMGKRGDLDKVAAHELELYIDNDSELYSDIIKSFLPNVARKMKSGTYDATKAPQLWSYLVERGAKKYGREFGDNWSEIFSPATRMDVAENLAGSWHKRLLDGEFPEIFIPKKDGEVSEVKPKNGRLKASGDKYKSDEDIAKEFEGMKVVDQKTWEKRQFSDFQSQKVTLMLEFPAGGESVGGGMEEEEAHQTTENATIYFDKDGKVVEGVALDGWYPEAVQEQVIKEVLKAAGLSEDSFTASLILQAKAPKGFEKVVKRLKEKFPNDKSAPFAIAWAMKNKGMKIRSSILGRRIDAMLDLLKAYGPADNAVVPSDSSGDQPDPKIKLAEKGEGTIAHTPEFGTTVVSGKKPKKLPKGKKEKKEDK